MSIFNIIKIVAIAAAVLAVAYIVNDYVTKTRLVAEYSAKLEIQRVTIDQKNKQIDQLKSLNQISNSIILDRDKKLEDLENITRGLTDNLGGDIDDQAPESLENLLRRLK